MPVPKKHLTEEERGQGEVWDIRKTPSKAREDKSADLSFSAPEVSDEVAPKTYTVQPGDSLSKIAKEQLGDASRWKEIFEANKETIKDPNLIRVGQEITLPER